MKTIIQVGINNFRQVEEEERNLFFRAILEELEIPNLDEYWPDVILTVEQKIKLRTLLQKYNIQIIDIGNSEFEMYVGNDIIARWNKPLYALKKDISQPDPKNRLFYEMTINCESVFERPDIDPGSNSE